MAVEIPACRTFTVRHEAELLGQNVTRTLAVDPHLFLFMSDRCVGALVIRLPGQVHSTQTRGWQTSFASRFGALIHHLRNLQTLEAAGDPNLTVHIKIQYF